MAATILFIEEMYIYPLKTFQTSVVHGYQPEEIGEAESEQQWRTQCHLLSLRKKSTPKQRYKLLLISLPD